jgi:hypothetical protein
VESNNQDSVEKDPTKVSRSTSKLSTLESQTLRPNYRRVGVNAVDRLESTLLRAKKSL